MVVVEAAIEEVEVEIGEEEAIRMENEVDIEVETVGLGDLNEEKEVAEEVNMDLEGVVVDVEADQENEQIGEGVVKIGRLYVEKEAGKIFGEAKRDLVQEDEEKVAEEEVEAILPNLCRRMDMPNKRSIK